jgi:hypothetical protein
MTENKPASYDTSEALEMLAAFTEKTEPDKGGAKEAAEALLEELYLVGRGVRNSDVEKTRHGDKTAVVVTTGKTNIWVMHFEGEIEIFKGANKDYPRNAQKKSLASVLRYNPAKQILEGLEVDLFRTPQQGAPRAQRSALAVVLEQVIALAGAASA